MTFHDRPDDLSDEALLADLQKMSFDYFLREANPENGLIRDRTRQDAPASIAAVGLALSVYPVGAARGFMTRAQAAQRTLATLRFLWNAPQNSDSDATGYKGFFYHFLDMGTGRRVWNCELSTVDTAFLMAGVLASAAYFDGGKDGEPEIRDLADRLYRRVDWRWAENGGPTVTHGWKPRRGFIRHRWNGYDEAAVLYVLGLGSPTFPLSPECYAARCEHYRWESYAGIDMLYAGPLFAHQLSHVWLDFRGIRDAHMAARDSDYFENSRRATYVQRQYAIDNPRGFDGYGETCWGITASDGPGPLTRSIGGRRRRFWDYRARGAPHGPDDGTLSPWAVVASLPFAPEIVMPAVRHFHGIGLRDGNPYGCTASFNPTLRSGKTGPTGWVAPDTIAINQGPMALMIENHRSGFLWDLMKRSPYIVAGLKRAGFTGGWLDDPPAG